MHASARCCDENKRMAFHQIIPWPHFQVARRGDSLAHRRCCQEEPKLVALMTACLAHLVVSYSLCWYSADQTGPLEASSPQVLESVPVQFVRRRSRNPHEDCWSSPLLLRPARQLEPLLVQRTRAR